MNTLDLMSLVSELARAPIEEYHTILTSRTSWFGKIINYFLPQNGVDVHATIYKIQNLMEKDSSVLKQPTFIKDAIHLTNKLDAHVYALLENNPNPENEKFLSFVFSFESCILTRISGDQTLEVIPSIKSRLVPENVISYLISTNFSQNITLATACCEYIEENRMHMLSESNCLKEPEKMLPLLNAGCLAKNDLIVKAIWKTLYLNKDLALFKADKKIISSLDYLLNKKEFSNQTLIVGDSQNPQEVLVNREILSQRNRYFHALFQTNFSEGSQDAITLKDQDTESIDYEGFLYLLRYIYTGNVDVPLDLCLTVSHLADLYLEPNLKKTCDKKKWDQAVLTLKHKNLTGKFQSSHYEEFFYLVHEIYTGKTDASSVITLKDLNIENLQNIDYQAVLYLLHYIYTSDEDVPSSLCSDVSRLADAYSEPDLKKICDQKILRSS